MPASHFRTPITPESFLRNRQATCSQVLQIRKSFPFSSDIQLASLSSKKEAFNNLPLVFPHPETPPKKKETASTGTFRRGVFLRFLWHQRPWPHGSHECHGGTGAEATHEVRAEGRAAAGWRPWGFRKVVILRKGLILVMLVMVKLFVWWFDGCFSFWELQFEKLVLGDLKRRFKKVSHVVRGCYKCFSPFLKICNSEKEQLDRMGPAENQLKDLFRKWDDFAYLSGVFLLFTSFYFLRP